MIPNDVLPSIVRLQIPASFDVNYSEDGLSVRCLRTAEREEEVTLEALKSQRGFCRRVLARTTTAEQFVVEFGSFKTDYGDRINGIIRATRPIIRDGLLALENPRFRACRLPECIPHDRCRTVCESWTAGIRYRPELTKPNGEVRPGLRMPQVGALHAIAAHWTLSDEPATVIMPTGTGKTEVMMAAAVDAACQRVLVVVPNNALRIQTAAKFGTYGCLRKIKVIDDLPYPVVGVLSSKPSPELFDRLRACNVVIATMSAIGLAEDDVQRNFVQLFSHVFFDEAHHIEATTWKKFQQHTATAKSLLLTATPFREDGKPLEGKIIYDYPLSAAQRDDLFAPISFVPVFEPDEAKADLAIAEAAVKQLRKDNRKRQHILMARAQTIEAAKSLYEHIYAPLYSEFRPVLIHSRTPNRKAVLEAIRNLEHRIVVCVDMFGEGFDLPNLKIAALHSVHKSLGVTLQFIGRFTRTNPDVGTATFVANTAEDGVPESLDSLYREDSDWNALLPDFSYDAIAPQSQLSEIVSNLESASAGDPEVKISTLALRPKISAQVYRASEFYPERFAEAFRPSQRVLQPQISRKDNILVLVVNQQDRVDWTDSHDIAYDSWDLLVAYFDPLRKMLYIHNSRKDESGGRLAGAISQQPALIRDEEVFKVFTGLRRLTLHSVGLSSRSRNVRYQMFAGLDVRNAVDPVQQHSKLKSNITGVGYEEGQRMSVGCSRKGKIWSMQSGSLADWRSWCDTIGAKLADPNRGPDDFLKYTLIPHSIAFLPQAQALMVDWPDQLFESAHFGIQVLAADSSYGFDECQLDLVSWEPNTDTFRFKLMAGGDSCVVLSLKLKKMGDDETYEVAFVSGHDLEIEAGARRWTATDYFQENPPLVRLEDGSQLSGNILLKPREELSETYDRKLIQEIDWSGIDIRKESRWKDGVIRQDSVQQRLIEHLLCGQAQFIIDDDDTGESADVVSIEETENNILVTLWHCKYSSGTEPGNRVKDLYEVCGQAQKCVKWTWGLKYLIRHLIERETKYRNGRQSRFIRGSVAELATLRKSARRRFVDYRIGIVQPGLSKADIPSEHLAVLGSTSSFLQCTTDHPLDVIGSP